MADNCPYWKHGKCAPPGHDVHDCSYSSRTYDQCAVYQMVQVRLGGGSMADALRAAGVIPPGARVVGSTSRDRVPSPGPKKKKWWQFWK